MSKNRKEKQEDAVKEGKIKHTGLFVIVLFVVALILSCAFALSEDELQAQKDAAQEARDAAQFQVDLTQNTIDGIAAQIDQANAAIAKIRTQIENLDTEILASNIELEDLEAKLTEAVQKKEQHQKVLEERMRVMYMYGLEGYSELLFSSQNIGNLVERIELIMAVMRNDRQVLTALKDAQMLIEERQAEVEAKKESLAAQKSEQEELQKAQESIKAQQSELLAQNQAIYNEYAAIVAEQEAAIKEAEAGLAEIAAQKQGKRSTSGSQRAGSANYIWPSDYYTITDYFGYRDAPIAGASTYHQGLDIGAAYGSPIYACASGEVTLARWYGGYGYCVMIAHDSGMTTLYGHQSSLAVYAGQSVTQGQVIGYCGSTGMSTGPHIHLSFINGSGTYVDPLDYL